MTTPSRDRPEGQTAGSEQRPPRSVAGQALTFDLPRELATLKEEPSWLQGDRNARTLVQESEIRITLTALKAGSQVKAHRAPAWVTIQTVEGHLRLDLGGEMAELPTGHVLMLEPNVTHDVEAVGESAFLLTIAGLDRDR